MNSINAIINIAENLKSEITDRESNLERICVTFMPEGPERKRFGDLYGTELMTELVVLTKLRSALEKVQKELAEIKV